MSDNLTLSDSTTTNTKAPDATIVSMQEQTDTSKRQNIRVMDGTKDSTAALAISAAGAALVKIDQTTPGTTNLVALSAETTKVIGTINIAAAQTVATVTTVTAVTGITNTVVTKEVRAATPTQTSPANSASSFTVLAANANRLGATIFNDDTAVTGATLKLKLGATASASSFTVEIAPRGYYEVPFGYTGIIDGIASAASGNARVTEVAA